MLHQPLGGHPHPEYPDTKIKDHRRLRGSNPAEQGYLGNASAARNSK